MRRALLGCGVVVLMAMPAGVLAAKPVDKANAAKECKAERGHDPATQEAFKDKYGKGKNHKNAYGRCVSQRTRENAAERKSAHAKAVKECKAERADGVDAFREKYGTNKNGRNAFGKCVSRKAKALLKKMHKEDRQEISATKNAAKECAAERDSIGVDPFKEKYGTNTNKSNAFGKCVSGKVSNQYHPTVPHSHGHGHSHS